MSWPDLSEWMSSTMTAKNQHYVPQMILKRFAVPATREKAIAVFDLYSGQTISSASIRHQAAKTFTYGEDGVAEKAFGDIETLASRAIAGALSESRVLSRNLEAQSAIAVYAALQHGRTPAAAAEFEAAQTSLLRATLQGPGVVPSEMAEHAKSVRAVYDKPELEAAMRSLELAPVLSDLEVVLLINKSPIEFICPDTGVTFHNQWAKPIRWKGVLGYACSGLQILLPVSSRAAFCLFDCATYEPRRNAKTIHLSAERDVSNLNRLLCATAERLAYFSGDEPTRAFLESMRKSLRMRTRTDSIVSNRLASETGNRHLITYHVQQPTDPYPFSWLKIRPSRARVPIHERGQALRPVAKLVFDELRSQPRRPSPDYKWERFVRLPD